MSGATLVIADYPVGYASGFGETLYNLFDGFPSDKLWTAHPSQVSAADGKTRAQSIKLPSPSRPRWVPQQVSLAYYPLLKAQQFRAAREAVRILSQVIEQHSIKNILAIPVSPWILFAALTLHKRHSNLNLVVYVMDDWQGHHECHQLPYSPWRRRLIAEVIGRANVRFAVSREMAEHYEEISGKKWLVVHNGVATGTFSGSQAIATRPKKVLLAGDVNVFRFDAVIAFAHAIERHNEGSKEQIQITVMGDVAEQHRSAFASLRGVRLLDRQSHADCLQAMKAADLLYLPLAFSKRSSRISRYSLPTKLPEYLASGKSVFFHAPKESAVFRVAERYDLKPRLASIDAAALDGFVNTWTQIAGNGHANGNGNALNVQRALHEEFDLKQLATRFQAAFI